MQREAWDVFMVHFQQTDWIQHKLWGYIERACRDANDSSERLQQIRQCYRAFDEHIGTLLEQAQDVRANQIVLSDHGFGPNRGKVCPNHVLQQLGYYHLLPGGSGRLNRFKYSRNRVLRHIYQTLRNVRAAGRGRQALKNYKSWADMLNSTIDREKTSVDWSRTKAAFVTGSEVGFIFINVRGRSPSGCVDPGQEYETLVNHLIAEFSSLTDDQGQKIFASVTRGTDTYPGRVADGALLPDLVLIPEEGYVVGAGLSESFRIESGERGDHRKMGILLVQGPEVQTNTSEFSPRLIDMAPTILHASGLPVPRDMDGRVLKEIFLDGRPVTFEDADDSQQLISNEYTPQETEVIEHRLRGLGYVE
jgi:predicted AlkP superfamily phosphohydrolase/phosphomutase